MIFVLAYIFSLHLQGECNDVLSCYLPGLRQVANMSASATASSFKMSLSGTIAQLSSLDLCPLGRAKASHNGSSSQSHIPENQSKKNIQKASYQQMVEDPKYKRSASPIAEYCAYETQSVTQRPEILMSHKYVFTTTNSSIAESKSPTGTGTAKRNGGGQVVKGVCPSWRAECAAQMIKGLGRCACIVLLDGDPRQDPKRLFAAHIAFRGSHLQHGNLGRAIELPRHVKTRRSNASLLYIDSV